MRNKLCTEKIWFVLSIETSPLGYAGVHNILFIASPSANEKLDLQQ